MRKEDLKKGYRVKLVNNIDKKRAYESPFWVSDMYKFFGKIVVVDGLLDDRCLCSSGGEEWYYSYSDIVCKVS